LLLTTLPLSVFFFLCREKRQKKMTFKNKIKLILVASNSYIGIIPTNNYLDTQLKKLKVLLKCVVWVHVKKSRVEIFF
jgi:hypothetical protein